MTTYQVEKLEGSVLACMAKYELVRNRFGGMRQRLKESKQGRATSEADQAEEVRTGNLTSQIFGHSSTWPHFP